jgi:dolichyl-phosphate-mannose--protein O-mannosyl transferase
MLMYYFMYKYYSMSFYDTKLSKTLVPLGICGVVMGLAIASKWTGIYAAAGLAVLFFITLFKRMKEYRFALKNPNGSTDGISHRHVIDTFKSSALKTIGFCCIFYIAIPILIYCLSYIPYLQAPGMHGISSIIDNQRNMYNYHSKLVAVHSFASTWYQWAIMYKPIWYYSGDTGMGLKEGISSFGNPAVWWVGIAAFLYQIYVFARKRDKVSLFLLLAYLAQLLPWTPIRRLTFIYHYFPSVPFVVLMIGHSLYTLYVSNPPTNKIVNIRNISIAYAVAAIALFAMFYPILSGMPIDPNFVETNLEWFSSWHFI